MVHILKQSSLASEFALSCHRVPLKIMFMVKQPVYVYTRAFVCQRSLSTSCECDAASVLDSGTSVSKYLCVYVYGECLRRRGLKFFIVIAAAIFRAV